MGNNRPIEKLGDSVYKFLFGFNFIKGIPGSYNKNFILERSITHSLWVGKISMPLPKVDFRDLNDRALLAFRLSKLVNAGIPQSKIIPIERVSFPDDFTAFPEAIDREVSVTRFEGGNITSFLEFILRRNLILLFLILEIVKL